MDLWLEMYGCRRALAVRGFATRAMRWYFKVMVPLAVGLPMLHLGFVALR